MVALSLAVVIDVALNILVFVLPSFSHRQANNAAPSRTGRKEQNATAPKSIGKDIA
jgi:hypothetical protein